MTRRLKSVHGTHPVSFRMPIDLYRDMTAVAQMRGVDLSAMLNWICSEYRPKLMKKKAEHEAALLEATRAGLLESLASEGGTGKALAAVRDLLKHLQDVYAALVRRSLDADARSAA